MSYSYHSSPFEFPVDIPMAVPSPKILYQAVKFVQVLVISSGMFLFLWCHLHATTRLILSKLELYEYYYSFLCSVVVISGDWNQPHAGSKKQVNMHLSLDKVQLFQDIIYYVFVIDFCWKFQYTGSWRSV